MLNHLEFIKLLGQSPLKHVVVLKAFYAAFIFVMGYSKYFVYIKTLPLPKESKRLYWGIIAQWSKVSRSFVA